MRHLLIIAALLLLFITAPAQATTIVTLPAPLVEDIIGVPTAVTLDLDTLNYDQRRELGSYCKPDRSMREALLLLLLY